MAQWDWYNEESKATLERGYLLQGESVQSAAKRIADSAARFSGDHWLSAEVYKAIANNWLVLPSPVWSNMGTERGLPISCFGSYIADSMESILDTLSEIGIMTKYGGGTSAYFGDLRGRGFPIKENGVSNGPVAFMQMYDAAMRVISQGSTRRGSMATYLPIEHPDIEDFLKIKTIGHPIQNLNFGVTVTDDFLNEMIAGDPNKRKIWAKILHARKELGYPYIIFSDTVNKMKPDVYKDYPIYASNLCTEIFLPSSINESFVCCLTALNAEKYDEWKDTNLVEIAVRFLDAVMEEFIQKASQIKHMHRAVRFSERHRALGLGFSGWHSYLQSKGIPFDSFTARVKTNTIFKDIKEASERATTLLALEKGEPEVCRGHNRRNSTLIAIAPNTSSSSIHGQCSPGIEPFNSNYYLAWLSKGSFPRKNKYLLREMDRMGLNTEEMWFSILTKGGSIQHIPELKDLHEVFKTFGEINQYSLLEQAGDRQKYIDQGQSLNIHIPPKTPVKKINDIHIYAWRCGVKGLYYQRSKSPSSNFSLEEVCAGCVG